MQTQNSEVKKCSKIYSRLSTWSSARFIYKRNEVFKYSTHALAFFLRPPSRVDIKTREMFLLGWCLRLFMRAIKLRNNKSIWFYYFEGYKKMLHIGWRECVWRMEREKEIRNFWNYDAKWFKVLLADSSMNQLKFNCREIKALWLLH